MNRQTVLSGLILSAVTTAFCCLQFAPQADLDAGDKRILNEIRERNHLMEDIEYLSDFIGPRLTGSPQLKAAEMWAVSAARQYGLENVHLEAWQIAHSWQRGSAQAQIVKPVLRRMSIASAGWSPATNGSVLGNVVYVERQIVINFKPIAAN